ncbi:MAG: glycosyltransferase [Saprospiraceae bacterium]|nr:glycosyltransferase [Saprospiraceae bacterium]
MIWLASFPRSGNTFFRNVLYEVYGIESSTYHQEVNYPLEPDYATYPVIKTHLLPHQLVPSDPSIKKVYIVREGRDALVSIAHHRKDIVQPGTDYELNLLEAILAMDGSFFGGWSENVKAWTEVADVVIRFEDLIADPIREIEKLREFMDLGEPNLDKLPTFKDLKFGTPHYGAGVAQVDSDEVARLAKKNFRRGVAGGWKDEMPPELEALFWDLHGEVMDQMGYTRGPIGEAWAEKKASGVIDPYRILIEGNKMTDLHMDGIRRYTEELIGGLRAFQHRLPDKWRIDVLVNGKIFPLDQYYGKIIERREAEKRQLGLFALKKGFFEQSLLAFKAFIQKTLPESWYNRLSPIYRDLPVRRVLSWIRGGTIKEQYRKVWKEAGRNHQLMHVPLPQHAFLVEPFKLPFVVTAHDLTHHFFPEYHEKENIDLAEKGMDFIREKASAVIAVSECTRQDLIQVYGIQADRIHTVYEAANGDRFRPQQNEEEWNEIRHRYGLPLGSYLISLSTLEPRKNLKHVIQAFLSLAKDPRYADVYLVICGRRGWKLEDLADARAPGFDRIIFTGHVLDDDLPLLYHHALALCYVAYYEGFGLPPLEAMRCQTPVIYGQNSAMPEIIAQGGLPADPSQPEDIARCMARVVDDASLRQELGQKALERSWYFSWLKTAFQTLNIYQQIIESNRADIGERS